MALRDGVGSSSLKELSPFYSVLWLHLFYPPILLQPGSSQVKNGSLQVGIGQNSFMNGVLISMTIVARFNRDLPPSAVPTAEGEKNSLDEKQSESRREDATEDLISPGDVQEEHFEWREVMRGLDFYYLKDMSNLNCRCPGYPSLAYRICLFWLHCELVFLFLIPVSTRVSGPLFGADYAARPTIVAGLGYSGGAAQLHTGLSTIRSSRSTMLISCLVPPYVPAVVLTGLFFLFTFSNCAHCL